MAYRHVRDGRTLSLLGAPARWRTSAGRADVYAPSEHLVGTEEELKGHDLSGAFRASDQTSARFKEACKALRVPATRRAQFKSPMRLLRQFNEATGADEGKKVIKLRNTRNEEKTSPRRTRLLKRVPAGQEDTTDDVVLGAPLERAPPFAKRVQALEPHQVLDVSNLDAATGKGARVCARPGARDHTRRGLEGVPLVSKTGAPLCVALRWLGLGERVPEVNW